MAKDKVLIRWNTKCAWNGQTQPIDRKNIDPPSPASLTEGEEVRVKFSSRWYNAFVVTPWVKKRKAGTKNKDNSAPPVVAADVSPDPPDPKRMKEEELYKNHLKRQNEKELDWRLLRLGAKNKRGEDRAEGEEKKKEKEREAVREGERREKEERKKEEEKRMEVERQEREEKKKEERREAERREREERKREEEKRREAERREREERKRKEEREEEERREAERREKEHKRWEEEMEEGDIQPNDLLGTELWDWPLEQPAQQYFGQWRDPGASLGSQGELIEAFKRMETTMTSFMLETRSALQNLADRVEKLEKTAPRSTPPTAITVHKQISTPATRTQPSAETPALNVLTPSSRSAVRDIMSKTVERHKAALKIMSVKYSKEELAVSNCSGTHGKERLDPKRLAIVKQIVLEQFPPHEEAGESAESVWKAICKKIDTKCRVQKFVESKTKLP